jgi:hypothetical protein
MTTLPGFSAEYALAERSGRYVAIHPTSATIQATVVPAQDTVGTEGKWIDIMGDYALEYCRELCAGACSMSCAPAVAGGIKVWHDCLMFCADKCEVNC